MKNILVLILLVTSNLASSQNAITWGMPMNVSMNMYGNSHPRMVMNAAGNPLVIWGRMSDASVYFSRWTGAAFTTPVKLNPSWMTVAAMSWQGPDIASKGDTVYVVMKETPEADTASHVYIVRSFDGGMTFSAPYQVDNIADSICRFPTVTVDGSGNPIVAFMKFDPGFGNARWVVAKSTNFGSTFSSDVKASGWSGAGADVCDCCPGAIISNGNQVSMLYRDAYTNIRDTWIGYSANGGATFTSGWNIDQNTWMLMQCPSSGPDAVVIGDTMYSVFMNGDSGNDLVLWSKTSMTSLNTAPSVPLAGSVPNLAYQNYVRIDKVGDVVAVVWKQNVNGGDELALRFTTNINTGLPTAYTMVDMGDITNTDVALSNGNIFVVWQDDNSGTVRYRKGTFSPASTDFNVEENPSVILYPNPATQVLNAVITGTGSNESVLVNAYDASGKLVYSSTLKSGQMNLDVSKWSKGLYTFSFIHPSGISHQRIVIQ